MAQPEANRRNINEAKEAFRNLVVAGCDMPDILELAEAAFNQVPQAIQRMAYTDPLLRDLRIEITGSTLRASIPSLILSES